MGYVQMCLHCLERRGGGGGGRCRGEQEEGQKIKEKEER